MRRVSAELALGIDLSLAATEREIAALRELLESAERRIAMVRHALRAGGSLADVAANDPPDAY